MARLTLAFLGGFQARAVSRSAVAVPSRKAQALLAYLALPAGQAHPREKLAARLWGESGERQARESLRQALAGLRKALPASRPPCLLVTSDTVAANPAAVEVVCTTLKLRAPGEKTAPRPMPRTRMMTSSSVADVPSHDIRGGGSGPPGTIWLNRGVWRCALSGGPRADSPGGRP